MPPGNMCAKPPVKVIEKATVEACLAIARKVQQARHLSGDESGSDTAGQVARLIEVELLRLG